LLYNLQHIAGLKWNHRTTLLINRYCHQKIITRRAWSGKSSPLNPSRCAQPLSESWWAGACPMHFDRCPKFLHPSVKRFRSFMASLLAGRIGRFFQPQKYIFLRAGERD